MQVERDSDRTNEFDSNLFLRTVAFAELDNVSPPHPANEVRDQVQIGDSDKSSKQFRASTHRRRLSGRPSIERMGLAAKPALVSTPSIPSVLSDDPGLSKASSKHRKAYERLAKQVSAWLQQEKTRRATRRAKRTASKEPNRREAQHAAPDHTDGPPVHHERRGSETSEGSVALENLANILERTLSLKSNESSHRKRRPSLVQGNKLSSMMKRQSVVSSDTDYFDGAEDLVPSCEAILDNSKTMAYSGGGAETVEEGGDATKQSRNLRKEKEREAWAAFKYEIVRITHTLRLKGWRRVPLNQSNEIEVERLSGALTNAVYVVSPPKNIRTPADKKSSLPTPKNPPP
jgi:choline kinase